MSKRMVAAAYGAVLLLAALPVLLFRYPKMVDYPNHLVRYYLTQVLPDHPILQRYLTNEWELIPNLGADLLALLAGSILPIYDVGRLVVLMAILLWFLAIIALQHALWNRISVWPLFAVAFLFNGNFAWGFLNFYVTTALAVLAFAGWIHVSGRHWAARVAYGLVAVFALYVGHLIAMGAYGLLIASYEIGMARREAQREECAWTTNLARRWLVAGVAFLPPAVLFLGVEAGHGDLKNVFTGPGDLLIALTSSIGQFNIPLDAALFVVCVLMFWHGLRRGRWLEAHPAMFYPLLVTLLVALVMPKMLLGIFQTHLRLPFLFFILLTVSCRFTGGPRAARIVGVLVAVLLVVRVGSVMADWKRHGEEVAELRGAFSAIEQGAKVFPAFGFPYEPRENYFKAHHWHSLSYVVIDRSAFVPTLFTGSLLTRIQPEFADIDDPQAQPVNLNLLAGEFESAAAQTPFVPPVWYRFDYLAVLFPQDPTPEALHPLLEPVAVGSFFRIYRIRKDN